MTVATAAPFCATEMAHRPLNPASMSPENGQEGEVGLVNAQQASIEKKHEGHQSRDHDDVAPAGQDERRHVEIHDQMAE